MSLRVIGTILLLVLTACKKGHDNEYQAPEPLSKKNGMELSLMYCGACHKYPEPELLDKNTWEKFVLPRMGYMYGIYENAEERDALFENNKGGELVRKRNLFPSSRTLDLADWEAIKAFYITKAPMEIGTPPKREIPKNLSQFRVRIPGQKMQVPSSTMAKFSSEGTIYLGDALTKSLSIFSKGFNLQTTGNVQEGAVSLFEGESALWLTVMGSFSPTDAPLGFISRLSIDGSEPSTVPIKNLQRPVHSSYGDLDGDGDTDIVVSEFGKWTGALSLFRNEGTTYKKEVIFDLPGAIKSYLYDMNGDGHKDIVALFAQGNEGIDIFYNDGQGKFERDRVLQFSPSMGGSFMNLIDFNKDGHMDLLFTAGDNADYYPVMKPWHGIYVFVNDGKNQFEEELFLHLNGAYNAVVNDFDGDGDMDVAGISFFPDWVNTPEESFVYFENKGNLNFSSQTFPEVNKGRWVVMDASDYDRDGDLDLILGSLAFEVVPKLGYLQKWMDEGIPFVVLENLLH